MLARRFGGRWNTPGVPMVYASSSLALAAIELFVHLEPNLQPDDLVSIAATLPEGEPALRMGPDQLPEGWWTDDFEPLRAVGDKWIREKSSLAVEVPSAALRVEWNVLVNPLHPAIAQIKVEEPQAFHFDARMFR
jgi:RES domain-containing protein